MELFSKKPKYALPDILKGLQQAVSSATSMLQAQQMDNPFLPDVVIRRLWVSGKRVGTSSIEVE